MSDAHEPDVARVMVLVRVPPGDAFAVFTEETDSWWRRGLAYRVAGSRVGTLAFEPGVGGRLFETFTADDGAERTHVSGEISVWQPPGAGVEGRLVFRWRGINFAPDESTEVEVRFVASSSGTQVTLEHRGFARLRKDHPVRHGEDGAVFIGRLGRWWGELLTSLREVAQAER